ncbi:hypothetical protein D3C87_1612200 [compost metagenome]
MFWRARGGGAHDEVDVLVVHGLVLDAPIRGVAGHARPVRCDDAGKAVGACCGDASIHQAGARFPDVQKAIQHTHAGVGFQGGVARITALVRAGEINKGGRIGHRRGIDSAQPGGRRGDDVRNVIVLTWGVGVVVVIAAAGGQGQDYRQGRCAQGVGR